MLHQYDYILFVLKKMSNKKQDFKISCFFKSCSSFSDNSVLNYFFLFILEV